MAKARMGVIYAGEEDSRLAKRLVQRDPCLSIAAAHTHLCQSCNRRWYCWCYAGEDRSREICLSCYHEDSLPKVIRKDGCRESKLFSHIRVSEGGWADRWVSTTELRAALRRWIEQEYEVSPPEVTHDAGSYQCGGCRFFLALDSDYGICANAASPHDGRIVFEHIGCKANPWYVKNHQTEAVKNV